MVAHNPDNSGPTQGPQPGDKKHAGPSCDCEVCKATAAGVKYHHHDMACPGPDGHPLVHVVVAIRPQLEANLMPSLAALMAGLIGDMQMIAPGDGPDKPIAVLERGVYTTTGISTKEFVDTFAGDDAAKKAGDKSRPRLAALFKAHGLVLQLPDSRRLALAEALAEPPIVPQPVGLTPHGRPEIQEPKDYFRLFLYAIKEYEGLPFWKRLFTRRPSATKTFGHFAAATLHEQAMPKPMAGPMPADLSQFFSKFYGNGDPEFMGDKGAQPDDKS